MTSHTANMEALQREGWKLSEEGRKKFNETGLASILDVC
jgi:hypothetical protein